MTTTVTEAYSRRAAEYTQLLGSMEAVHASDRQLIDGWADTLAGPVLDAGCGPGHWTHHLAGRGLDVRGIDLVPAFVEHARQSYPAVPFRIGSIDAIEEADRSLGGVLSWYSTIHHHPSRIAATFDEFARVLRPGGGLVVGFFDGPALEAFDHAVTPAYRWPPEELERLLTASGFTVSEIRTRAEEGQRPVGAIVAELRSAP
ncbi:class I SAM-dependent methyltransferase [Mumia zhuanghuii]|uniref:Class I SAM-dependent methyltransferase n=1 Tax=Mumia zhuanghuii TaxID=2585211 RepID=A0A5C4N382_9ACTN|nr:class I SAM-dependent methyltransferase [Mumia zhuanghuii]TNC51417.1 class I SAM-dependent methyltransferase [Mumia zhuanghuii]